MKHLNRIGTRLLVEEKADSVKESHPSYQAQIICVNATVTASLPTNDL